MPAQEAAYPASSQRLPGVTRSRSSPWLVTAVATMPQRPVRTSERGDDVHILAIDQGTSGTKAIVWSPERGVVGSAEATVRPRYLADGGVEVDARELLESVLDTGGRAVAESGVRPDVVALANQGETVLAWDRATGRALSPAMVWQDRRAESLCRDLAAEGPRLARATGLTLDPYFSAPKMAWLRRTGNPYATLGQRTTRGLFRSDYLGRSRRKLRSTLPPLP